MINKIKLFFTRMPTTFLLIVLVLIPTIILFVHIRNLIKYYCNTKELLAMLNPIVVGCMTYIGAITIGLSAYSLNYRNRKNLYAPKMSLLSPAIDGEKAVPQNEMGGIDLVPPML